MDKDKKPNYDLVAKIVVKKTYSPNHKDAVKKSAKETIMRWGGNVDETEVEKAIEKAVENLKKDKSKTARKPDMLVARK